MIGKVLLSTKNRSTAAVSQLQSTSRRSFASVKSGGFSEATTRFTDVSFKMKREARSIKTKHAKELFQDLIRTDPQNKRVILYESLTNFEKQNLSVNDISIYSGNGNKMPMDSLAWHINMGKPPYYPAHPETVDMKQVIPMIKRNISSEAHLLIEERGTLNGSNLVHLVTELQESFKGITGIGSDINLPSLAIGIATNNYLGTQDYIKVGFGSAFAISSPIPSMTKAVCLFNLISILSPKNGLMALESSAKSLNAGDILVLTIHMNNEKTIKSQLKDNSDWKLQDSTKGIVSFSNQPGLTLRDIKNYAISERAVPSDFDFDPQLVSTPISESSLLIQQLTFYSKDAIVDIVKGFGFIIRDDNIHEGNHTTDLIDRTTIVCQKL